MPEPSREAREAAEEFAVEFVTSKPHGSAGDEIIWLGDRITLPIVDSPGQTAVSVAMMRVTIKRALARALDEFARPLREEAMEARELRGFLFAHGYRPCDIGACNCGSWHGGHASARLREIYEALGGCNGTLPVPEIERLIDERDTLREELKQARTDAPHFCALDHEPIRHADSEHERCPLCRAIDERDALRKRVGELEAAERWLEEHCPDDIVPLEDTHLSRVQFVLDHLLVERKVRGFTAFVLTGDEDGDVQRGAEDMKARADRAEAALDEIAELDPEELGENDDEWGGAAVGARAQEIAEEARRGRGDG